MVRRLARIVPSAHAAATEGARHVEVQLGAKCRLSSGGAAEAVPLVGDLEVRDVDPRGAQSLHEGPRAGGRDDRVLGALDHERSALKVPGARDRAARGARRSAEQLEVPGLEPLLVTREVRRGVPRDGPRERPCRKGEQRGRPLMKLADASASPSSARRRAAATHSSTSRIPKPPFSRSRCARPCPVEPE